ncbi:MAG: M20/M25/M40 family metallo-hydrolase [Candidatus Cloacimonadaceae bacterium]|nr:M20/M25/M40 family metallo-hydrolase [Candidatus Cloacimonadaceae bacterium]
MKKFYFLFACIFAISILVAQYYEPIPEILNLISLINADTLAAHVQHLQNYQTRHALAGNQLQIATWIGNQLQSYGISNTYMQEYQHLGTTQYNVIATIPGYLHPGRYVIVSAHYDSQSLNSSNYTWAPGADDNASGTAGLLEMARVMKLMVYQPRCTIRFIAFSAEEGNGWGSEEYCDYALSENHDIRISVNLDMIASNQPVTNEFRVVPFTGSPLHCKEAIAFSEPYTSLQPVEGPMNLGGDGIMFNNAGYPSVMFIERHLSPYWHSGEDVIGNLDFQYAHQIMSAATATTAVFANQPIAVGEVSVFDTGTGNSLLAQWGSSPDPEVSHYAVYCGADINAMTFWQNVNETQCLITGLIEGQYYHIAVAAVNSAGYSSIRAFADGTPLSVPLTPQNLKDFPTSGAITITWDLNTELDLASYNIYRALGPDETLAMIGTVPAPQTSFTDTEVSSNLEYYYYSVSAIDTQNQQSPLSEAVTSRMVSLDRGIYVIDESKNFGGSSPFQPTDLAVDDFYAALLEGYAHVQHLDLEEYSGTLRLADIGIYSSILWHGNDNSDFTYPYHLKDVLRQYVFWGGKVFFSVYFPSKAFELNAGYPALFPSDSFMNEVLGIGGVYYSVGARFKYAIPSQENYLSLQVDNLKTLASWQGHIFCVEGLEPVNPEESIFIYASDYSSSSGQGILNGSSVGVHHYYGAGQTVCVSFPLYNMQVPASEALMDYVFGTLFNESTEVPEDQVPPIFGFSILPNYPNPFNTVTTIKYSLNEPGPISLDIYNLKGQLVKTLFRGNADKGNHTISWNGTDNSGNACSSGVYFYKLRTSSRTMVRKMLMLK